jgi:hypothetical protein
MLWLADHRIGFTNYSGVVKVDEDVQTHNILSSECFKLQPKF